MSEPIEELGGRTWDELEPIEHESGAPMLTDKIRKRGRSGWVEQSVRVMVPRPAQMFAARAEARAWAAEAKLDMDRDVDLLGEMEQLCILAKAVRTAEPPHPQFASARELATDYDEASLQELIARVSHYKTLLDPRPSDFTEERVFELVAKIARVGHFGPLVDIAGPAQPSFLLRMAELAYHSETVQRWQRSHETLIPAPSPSPNSDGS